MLTTFSPEALYNAMLEALQDDYARVKILDAGRGNQIDRIYYSHKLSMHNNSVLMKSLKAESIYSNYIIGNLGIALLYNPVGQDVRLVTPGTFGDFWYVFLKSVDKDIVIQALSHLTPEDLIKIISVYFKEPELEDIPYQPATYTIYGIKIEKFFLAFLYPLSKALYKLGIRNDIVTFLYNFINPEFLLLRASSKNIEQMQKQYFSPIVIKYTMDNVRMNTLRHRIREVFNYARNVYINANANPDFPIEVYAFRPNEDYFVITQKCWDYGFTFISGSKMPSPTAVSRDNEKIIFGIFWDNMKLKHVVRVNLEQVYQNYGKTRIIDLRNKDIPMMRPEDVEQALSKQAIKAKERSLYWRVCYGTNFHF